MSEVRVVDLKELGVSKEIFDHIYSMGEEDGRADAIDEFVKLIHKNINELNHHQVDFLAEQIIKGGVSNG